MLKIRFLLGAVCSLLALNPVARGASETMPSADLRASQIRTLDTLRSFPSIANREEWKTRASNIRQQILVSAGLWPMPQKPPLAPVFSGKVEKEDYTIEKVYFSTHPGFYLAGNLYRPKNRGTEKVPGILNPHGHWGNGRLVDDANGSVAARCIQFARMGMVAFSYDMVGYNDTQFTSTDDSVGSKDFYKTHNTFARAATNQLWNLNLMGLQTWNSIRALDFLESLPDVDPARLACTGESGGATQTFLLGAIDDRIAVQAPVVMVSHSMQGGCLCENMPGLRIEFSNMEISAAFAPKPQILVGATGDWTKTTQTVEGPAIREIYRLLGHGQNFEYTTLDYEHNYNRDTREKVYAFFAQHLLKKPAAKVEEIPYQKEKNEDLLVFHGQNQPLDRLSESSLVEQLISKARNDFQQDLPKDLKSLGQFRQKWMPLWQSTLQLPNEVVPLSDTLQQEKSSELETVRFAIGWSKSGNRLPALYLKPSNARNKHMVLLFHELGKKQFVDASLKPKKLTADLLRQGYSVLLVDLFLTGELVHNHSDNLRKPSENYFTTYNRTDAQERIRDIATAIAFARKTLRAEKVITVGIGKTGFYTLLTAPLSDGTAADLGSLNLDDNDVLLEKSRLIPGIRRFGGVDGALALAAPKPVLIQTSSSNLRMEYAVEAYRAGGDASRVSIQREGNLEDSLSRFLEQKF